MDGLISAVSLFDACKSAIGYLGFILLPWLVNIPRTRRHQQIFMPVVAFIYTIVALIVLYLFNKTLEEVVFAWLFSYFPILKNYISISLFFYIENAAIIIVFMVIKLMYRRFATNFFQGDDFFGISVVKLFFDYDSISNRWYIQSRFGKTRSFYCAFFVGSVLCTLGIIVAIKAYPELPAFGAICFPLFGTIVLGELYYALHGLTDDEVKDSLYGESEENRHVSNYSALRAIYRKLFPERILDDGIELSSPVTSESFNAIYKLRKSDDETERTYGEYFDRLKKQGIDIDENLMLAGLNLLKGKSCLFCTPFYHDLTSYVSFSCYVRLLEGGKCLIIVGRDANASDIANWINQGLEDISGIPNLWSVGVIGEIPVDNLDVGVLRAADLHRYQVLAAHNEFLSRVEIVLLSEPSKIVATSQLGLGVLAAQVSQKHTPVFAAFDRNADGLVDTLSHVLKTNFTSVIATQPNRGSSSDVVWAGQGERLIPRIIPGVVRDLGMGTELAAVAMKYNVEKIGWVGGQNYPVLDMSWIAGQYAEPITSYAEIPHSQQAFQDSFLPLPNPPALKQKKHSFLIVEDEIANVHESLRLYGSRSTFNGFVNLISHDYLLRDYMADNRRMFHADRKAIPTIVSDYSRSTRSTVLRLLLELVTFSVPLESIVKDLELSGCIEKNLSLKLNTEKTKEDDSGFDDIGEPLAITRLREMMSRYFQVAEDSIIFEVTKTPKEEAGKFLLSYRLADITVFSHVLNGLHTSYFVVEDERCEQNYISACLSGHVAQCVLPGQFLTYGGKYYQVQAIEVGNARQVVLRRAADHVEGRPAYRPLLDFTISNIRPQGASYSHLSGSPLRIQRMIVEVKALTKGYLDLPSRSDLTHMRRVDLPDLPTRSYVDKQVLCLKCPGVDPKVRASLAVLLNELFVSIFPDSHQFLWASTAYPGDEFEGLLPEFTLAQAWAASSVENPSEKEKETEEGIRSISEGIYIIEDSDIDLGLLEAFERNWERFFNILSDYLLWLTTPVESEGTEVKPEDVTISFPGESMEEVQARQKRKEKESQRALDKELPFWRRFKEFIKYLLRRKHIKLPTDPIEGKDKPTKLTLGQRIKLWFKRLFGRGKTGADNSQNPLSPDFTEGDDSAVEPENLREPADEAITPEGDSVDTGDRAEELAEDEAATIGTSPGAEETSVKEGEPKVKLVPDMEPVVIKVDGKTNKAEVVTSDLEKPDSSSGKDSEDSSEQVAEVSPVTEGESSGDDDSTAGSKGGEVDTDA